MKVRHGDLLIEKVSQIKSMKRMQGNILAEGEVTGHTHQLLLKKKENLQMYGEQQVEYFDLREKAKLVHPEHKQIVIPKGKYKVTRQREYSPSENRQIAD